MQKTDLNFSEHAILRMDQRGYSTIDINYVVTYGTRYCRAGALHCYLRYKDIPEWHRKFDKFRRLEGTTVLLGEKQDTQVITVYRDMNGTKRIRQKTKYHRNVERYEHLPLAV